MSLQETSSLPPNNIIDERTKGISIINGSSQRRLAQLTERAVDKALKLNMASRRLVDVVDIQSCGEAEDLGCGIKSAFTFKLFKGSPKLAMSPGPSLQNWALGRKVQDRLIRGRIYSLLMRWRSDPTFEWKARVALAVPILQEALYRVADYTEEEHISQQCLESYLERVLLQFEAGNGPLLLQNMEACHPSMRCTPENESSTNQITIPFETSGDNAAQSGIISDMHAQGMNSPFTYESHYEGNTKLKLDHGARRDSTQMQTTGRVVNMLLKKTAAANKTRSKCGPSFRALHSEENIANTYTRLHNKASAETFKADNEPHAHESTYQQNVVTARFSPRKTLGDMINLNWSNGQASGDSLIMPSSSHLLTWGENGTTTTQPNGEMQLSSDGLSLPSSPSTEEILPTLEEPMPLMDMSPATTLPLPSFLTSFSVMSPSILSSLSKPHQSLPQTSDSSPSSPLMTSSSCGSLSPIPQKSDASSSPSTLSSSLPLMSDIAPSLPLLVSSAFLSLSASSLQVLPDPLPSSSLSVSTSFPLRIDPSVPSLLPSMPDPFLSSSLSVPSFPSIPSMPDPLVSSPLSLSSLSLEPSVSSSLPTMSEPSSSSLPHPLVSSSVPMPSEASPSLPIPLVSPPIESPSPAANDFLPQPLSTHPHAHAQCSHEMPSSVSDNRYQMQQPRYSMCGQLRMLGCETEVQASARQETEPQGATMAAFLSTSPLSSFSMTESMDEVSRERSAVRLPLSIFLAERDECKMKDMERWEEPTEQMDPLCCVCMVGLKGAAFIPCGHTFCRKCSRELWRGRGACPLCNRFIREILDVY